MSKRSCAILVLFCCVSARGPASEAALFSLDTVTAAPGQSEVVLNMMISPAAADLPIMSWTAVIGYDSSVMTVASMSAARPTDLFLYSPPEIFTEQGRVAVEAAFSMRNREELYLSQSEPVATITLCVFKTAPAGSYPITILPVVTGRPIVGPSQLETKYTDAGMNVSTPRMAGGAVVVSGDVVEDSTCQQPVWDYVPAPSVAEVTYIFRGPAVVQAGQSFTVDWLITSNIDLVSYAAAFDFDETVLSPPVVTINEEWLGPKHFVMVSVEKDGYIEVTPLTKIFKAGSELRVASLTFTALDRAAVATEVAFVDEVERANVDREGNVGFAYYRNVVTTIKFEAEEPETGPVESVMEPAVKQNLLLQIVEPAAFIRGDANGDGAVNISDPLAVLGFLFLGSEASECLDAADADDSGHVGVTDPIYVLNYLFRGGPVMPPPGPQTKGVDPTDDELSCD